VVATLARVPDALPTAASRAAQGAASVPAVTVAILAFNRRDELAETLRALRDRLDYPADRLDVIVVDNASSDGTPEMVRGDFPDVRLIVTDANVGVSAWNRALEVAEGDYVLLLDDDCYVEGAALRDAVGAAREHDADLVSFYVRSPGEHRDFSADITTGLLSFWGCSALLSRRAVQRLGGFDPEIFIWGHEVEFTARLLDAGLTHLYLPAVTSLHQKVPASEFALRGWRFNARNHAYIAAKLLRPVDALLGLVNFAGFILAEGLHHRERLVALGDVVQGALAGARRRSPVRPAVSRTYRRNFVAFAGPLLYFRGPVSRWRTRADPDAAGRYTQSRLAAYYAARPRFYPRGSGVLRLDR
jgi:GT2 family glycosyltransferase